MRVALVRSSRAPAPPGTATGRPDLAVVDGVGIVAIRDKVIVMRAGDTVYMLPGEEHRHRAMPDRFMAHLAMWVLGSVRVGEAAAHLERLVGAPSMNSENPSGWSPSGPVIT